MATVRVVGSPSPSGAAVVSAAASVLSGNERYEMADNVQVYLWYKGQYYATKLAYVNSDDYYLTGWYDNFGCTAGKKVRVIIAVKKD